MDPFAPDGDRIAEVAGVVLGREDQAQRPGELASGRAILLVVAAVDAEPRPVVLAHPVHHVRVAEGGP